jgi:hypothetical protein
MGASDTGVTARAGITRLARSPSTGHASQLSQKRQSLSRMMSGSWRESWTRSSIMSVLRIPQWLRGDENSAASCRNVAPAVAATPYLL